MKRLQIIIFTVLLLQTGYVLAAELQTADSQTYQASIMAFGVDADTAAQATQAVMDELAQHEPSEVAEEPKTALTATSTAWLDNPYQID